MGEKLVCFNGEFGRVDNVVFLCRKAVSTERVGDKTWVLLSKEIEEFEVT